MDFLGLFSYLDYVVCVCFGGDCGGDDYWFVDVCYDLCWWWYCYVDYVEDIEVECVKRIMLDLVVFSRSYFRRVFCE